MSARSAPERLRRRDRLRRALFWIVVGAALVVAFLLVRCGGGFGLGGGGGSGVGAGSGLGGVRRATGTGTGTGSAVARCALRVDGTGVVLGDRPVAIAAAVDACRAAGAADVVVTGDARQGTWDALRGALEASSIAIHVRGPVPPPPDAGP